MIVYVPLEPIVCTCDSILYYDITISGQNTVRR